MQNRSVEQKKKTNRLEIYQDLLGRLEIEPEFVFLDKVITGDESWVFDYDPETKRQSTELDTKKFSSPEGSTHEQNPG